MIDTAVTLGPPPPAVPAARTRPTGITLIDETIKAHINDATDISWAHLTFNPWAGCARVSPACGDKTGGGCYAEAQAKRFAWGKVDGQSVWGVDAPRHMMSDGYWKQPAKWNRLAAKLGVRLRVFCASIADVFDDHPDVESARARLWATIEATPNLDWLLLTKRPQNIARMVPASWMAGAWPVNCWMGSTMENQRYADLRTRWLAAIPAPVVFASYAPALGPVTFNLDVIDWVVAEGESGHHARPAHPAWFEATRDQCAAAGRPFHLKQWGEFGPYPPGWPDTPGCMGNRSKAYAVAHDGRHWPEQELAIRYFDPEPYHGLPWNRPFEYAHPTGAMLARENNAGQLRLHVMHRVGLKHSGRELDDREWMQVPVSPAGLAVA